MSIDNKPSVDKTETPTPSDVVKVNETTETKSQEETTENVDVIEIKLLRPNHKKKQLRMLM